MKIRKAILAKQITIIFVFILSNSIIGNAQSVDSSHQELKVDQISDSDQNEYASKWFYDNSPAIIGAVLGALLAGIVALISILWTHKKNLLLQQNDFRKKKKIEEDIYCGNLFAIYYEIMWHKSLLDRLRIELIETKRITLSSLSFPYNEVKELFSIEYLDKCRMNVLHYSRFDTQLLSLISTYMNLIMTINNNLNFESAIHLSKQFKSPVQIKKAIKEYFEILENWLMDAENGMNSIQEGVKEVVHSFPDSEMEFDFNLAKSFKDTD